MRQSWRIWIALAICLGVVLPAMGWLTHRALQLDAAEAAARARAEQEENLSVALWRIDSELTQLLATEAARPHFVYQPFYSSPAVPIDKGGKGGGEGELQWTPSPLLAGRSPFVLLHFEVTSRGDWSSPQCPSPSWRDAACQFGLTEQAEEASTRRMRELAAQAPYAALDKRLPQLSESVVVASADGAPPGLDGVSPLQNSVEWQRGQFAEGQQQLPQTGQGDAPEFAQQAAAAPQQAFGQGFELERRSQSRSQYSRFNRDSNLRAAAQQQAIEQRRNVVAASSLDGASVGVAQPIWVDGQLLLVRRVAYGGKSVIQGCWLDWPAMREHLQQQVAPLVQDVKLKPVTVHTPPNQLRPGRLLATLPVQLAAPEPIATPAVFSPVRVSLMMAWACLLAVLCAVAVMLVKVVALSERRAAFVSSVTHELRTPLTTFRLYSEMLAEGMAQSDDQRQTYYETLRAEADRLYHLVENVLAYSRLERGRAGKARELVNAPALIDSLVGRLTERAAHADMELVVEIDSSARQAVLRTDPAAVEQILFNLVDNASKYAAHAADRRIHLAAAFSLAGRSGDGRLTISVGDHGPGLSSKDARRGKRPFSKSAQEAANSAPGVGLGLALCRRLAKALGGRLRITSHAAGARVSLELPAAVGRTSKS